MRNFACGQGKKVLQAPANKWALDLRKARAAMQGVSMKQLLQRFVERGLQPEHPNAPGPMPRSRTALPTVSIGQPLARQQLSNAALFEVLDSAADLK
jgi:hypothetical protein